MNNKFIKKLEESFENVEGLELEDAIKILKKKYVIEGFSKIFKNIKRINSFEIDELTSNFALKNLISIFAYMQGIEIVKNEEISMSELDDFYISYLDNIRNNANLSENEVESLLLNKTEKNKSLIAESYLEKIYYYSLKFASDTSMFEELLQEGNEVLLSSIEKYDKEKHISFETLLFYNLNTSFTKKLKWIYNDEECFDNYELVIDNLDDIIAERVAIEKYVSDMFDSVFLTKEEEKIIKLRYGLEDGYEHSPSEISSILKISKIDELCKESNAVKKLKLLKNDNKRKEVLQ